MELVRSGVSSNNFYTQLHELTHWTGINAVRRALFRLWTGNLVVPLARPRIWGIFQLHPCAGSLPAGCVV